MRLDIEESDRIAAEHEVNSIDWLDLDEVEIENKAREFADRMCPHIHDSQDQYEHSDHKEMLLILIITELKSNAMGEVRR